MIFFNLRISSLVHDLFENYLWYIIDFPKLVLQNEIINGSHPSPPTSGQISCPMPLFDVVLQPYCFEKN